MATAGRQNSCWHEDQNLIIFKAFTKLYGMAGVRLGYCLSADAALLEKMRHAGQPWAVSSLAQAAGVAALKETAYVARVRALIAAQKPRLTAGLRALGLRVIAGQGQLSAIAARAGDSRRAAAAKGGCPARLRQLSGAGRQLVPHCRAHGAGK